MFYVDPKKTIPEVTRQTKYKIIPESPYAGRRWTPIPLVQIPRAIHREMKNRGFMVYKTLGHLERDGADLFFCILCGHNSLGRLPASVHWAVGGEVSNAQRVRPRYFFGIRRTLPTPGGAVFHERRAAHRFEPSFNVETEAKRVVNVLQEEAEGMLATIGRRKAVGLSRAFCGAFVTEMAARGLLNARRIVPMAKLAEELMAKKDATLFDLQLAYGELMSGGRPTSKGRRLPEFPPSEQFGHQLRLNKLIARFRPGSLPVIK